MNVSIDRIVAIIACMYETQCEIIVYIPNTEENEDVECCLSFGKLGYSRMSIFPNEIDCLEYNEIIEFDSGCDEGNYRTKVYKLTKNSQYRIQEIIKNKKLLLIKE